MTCSLNKGLHGNSISALRHGGGEGGGDGTSWRKES